MVREREAEPAGAATGRESEQGQDNGRATCLQGVCLAKPLFSVALDRPAVPRAKLCVHSLRMLMDNLMHLGHLQQERWQPSSQ